MAESRERDRRPHGPRQSRIIGPATFADGTRTTAYAALAELTCDQCGRAILPGETFTRQTPRAVTPGHDYSRLTKRPVCTTCRPLHMEIA